MEKDIGKIKKNDDTDIVIRVDDFGGKVGLTIREYLTSERYTGFTKQGTRIPADKIVEFKKLISSIDDKEIEKMKAEAEAAASSEQGAGAETAKQAGEQATQESDNKNIEDY